jgi:hypothetical protein
MAIMDCPVRWMAMPAKTPTFFRRRCNEKRSKKALIFSQKRSLLNPFSLPEDIGRPACCLTYTFAAHLYNKSFFRQ